MMHAAIDLDGQLVVRNTHPFGGRLTDRVTLDPLDGVEICAWVGDRSLLDDPRNPVATALLIALGASPYPFAGEVFITGFQRNPPDPCDLPAEAARFVGALNQYVRIALGLDNGLLPATHSGEWAAAVREVGEMAHTAVVVCE